MVCRNPILQEQVLMLSAVRFFFVLIPFFYAAGWRLGSPRARRPNLVLPKPRTRNPSF